MSILKVCVEISFSFTCESWREALEFGHGKAIFLTHFVTQKDSGIKAKEDEIKGKESKCEEKAIFFYHFSNTKGCLNKRITEKILLQSHCILNPRIDVMYSIKR